MKTLEESIKLLCDAYKRTPNQEYIDKLKTYLVHDLKLNLETIEILCRRIPEVVKSFPSRVDVNNVLSEIRKNKSKFKKVTESTSQVRTSPEKTKGELLGIPTSIETLCQMIDRNETECGAFIGSLHRLRLSESDLWAIYEARAEGRLHPVVEEYRRKKGYIK